MIVRIQLFAGLAEACGGPLVELDAGSGPVTGDTLKKLLTDAYPGASGMIAQSFLAVNRAYAPPEAVISESDEIALIPPVSGGQGEDEDTRYSITYKPLFPEQVSAKVLQPGHGAALAFIGTTREFTDGKRTMLLEYEAYLPMALATMKQIGAEIGERWPGTLCAISHRIGRVGIGEASVVIAVSSPHRAECYEASRYAIERLKQIVPIWKKEIWEDGSEWKGHQLGPWNPLVSPYAPGEKGGGNAGE